MLSNYNLLSTINALIINLLLLSATFTNAFQELYGPNIQ